MPRAITARHDTLVQILANMFKRAGVVNIEVKCEGETRVRPDIEIILSDRSLLWTWLWFTPLLHHGEVMWP